MSQPDVTEYPGKPNVFVTSGQGQPIIEVTTDQHMRYANMPLKKILEEICEAGRHYANQILGKYDYPNGEWFPCGSADIVLRWNQHRDIIKLFQKEGTQESKDYWTGWFGKLHKTGSLGWWFPKLDVGSQAMRFEEEVCKFIRDKLVFANIKVDVRTFID